MTAATPNLCIGQRGGHYLFPERAQPMFGRVGGAGAFPDLVLILTATELGLACLNDGAMTWTDPEGAPHVRDFHLGNIALVSVPQNTVRIQGSADNRTGLFHAAGLDMRRVSEEETKRLWAAWKVATEPLVRRGRPAGRAPLDPEQVQAAELARELRRQGKSWKRIEQDLGESRQVLDRWMKRLPARGN
jgi:hypothetical protein